MKKIEREFRVKKREKKQQKSDVAPSMMKIDFHSLVGLLTREKKEKYLHPKLWTIINFHERIWLEMRMNNSSWSEQKCEKIIQFLFLLIKSKKVS